MSNASPNKSLVSLRRRLPPSTLPDEVWNLYRGSGFYLYTWGGSDAPPRKIELSAASENFCHVVPAGYWQAAEPVDGTVLVGCSVGPGFEYNDFELIDPDSDPAGAIRINYPDLSKFVTP